MSKNWGTKLEKYYNTTVPTKLAAFFGLESWLTHGTSSLQASGFLGQMGMRCGLNSKMKGHLNTDCSYEAALEGTAGYDTWTRAKIIRELENQPKPTAPSTKERQKVGVVRVKEQVRVTRLKRGQTLSGKADFAHTPQEANQTQSTRIGNLNLLENRHREGLEGCEGNILGQLILRRSQSY
ncbi:hypothetical protein Pyn_21868 [Prunus yedoensis var. nudiflora]|uniref:Uncharacterized protein n=1 Tax=Prunus yedoensis var. nudiflora TaxID=2094558 RepID=A0A314XTI6_PRUYE|nr:hypothetical protein Pyn_21868 [Prunus yedoensis var. nudiflora]